MPDATSAGTLTCDVQDGALRTIRIGDVEVLRQIAAPIRDADWATLTEENVRQSADGGHIRRSAQCAGGALETRLDYRIDAQAARIEATFEARALRDVLMNRAGFALLHPLAGVRGAALTVTHPDGRVSEGTFPLAVVPSQPARDIAGLRHVVGGVAVDIAMTGEVFEMEDQRNWTDASYKTYCRPLGAPRPFTLAAGEVLRQRVTLNCFKSKSTVPGLARTPALTPTRPRVALATEAAWWRDGDAAVLKSSGAQALQLRVRAGEDAGWVVAAMTAARAAGMDVTLEVILGDDTAALPALAATLDVAGHRPDRIVALPETYMASHQPEGPWPSGATPADAACAARSAFPGAETGVGMLTYFPELNRCPPAPGPGAFVTFGTSAIVHAADDLSVRQTMEALPDVFATARTMTGTRPLRLGLCAIGMRTNPYGTGTVANPDGQCIAMAGDDPRQQTDFAATFARDLWRAAGRAGVVEIALAAPSGPFGITRDGRALPIAAAVAACAREAAA